MTYLIDSGIQISIDGTTWYKLTDHNREPIDIATELIETQSRMANGTMRKYVVSQKNNIVVSPNPVTEKLNIETEGKIISVSIYDFKGSLVKTISGDSKTVNVSDLSVGSYLIKVKTNKAEFTKKVIKK